MSDSRIQRLQRAWEATRSFEDEVAFLREQLRTGELTLERVKAAADAGHMSARFVSSDRRQPLSEPSTREPWLPLRELGEYTPFAWVCSLPDFEWRFPGPSLIFDPRRNPGPQGQARHPLPFGSLSVVRLEHELAQLGAPQSAVPEQPVAFVAGGNRWRDLTFDPLRIAVPYASFTLEAGDVHVRSTAEAKNLGSPLALDPEQLYRVSELKVLDLGGIVAQVLSSTQLYSRARALD